MITNVYCFLHKNVKKLLGKSQNPERYMDFVYIINARDDYMFTNETIGNWFINDKSYETNTITLYKSDLFFGENTVSRGTKICLNEKNIDSKKNIQFEKAEDAWLFMLENSFIPDGWRNSGFCQTGYIYEEGKWCLSSWIWTSAAVARCCIKLGKITMAKNIADAYIRKQLPDGGWVVRYDYTNKRVIPVVAPNDSAYIANNALLEVYLATLDAKYLEAAEKTAQWIINTARLDGLVYLGYDNSNGNWITNVNIVDIGFTAGLFAKLYNITQKNEYLIFLKKFINAYIKSFYNHHIGAFATSIDKNGKPQGGFFGRGQAWALEGLIPAYIVMQTNELKQIIIHVTDYIIKNQQKTGAWPYNFCKLFMGPDCKGTSVIAKSLLDWYKINNSNKKINDSVLKAMDWCKKHTCLNGEATGGIFSKNVEGAIVHHLYTSTAFVYSTAYALEVLSEIGEFKYDSNK